MGREWIQTTLGDVLELKRGYDLPKQERLAGHIPVVSSSGTSGFHSEAKVKGPGVVTGRYGTLGEVFYIERDFWPLNTTLYVRDFKGNDPRFVAYFLQLLRFDDYSDKGAVPGVNRNHLHMAPVFWPKIDEQQRISALLGSIDDKIMLNGGTAASLEKIARTLFQSWFVDFDPVCRAAAGEDTGLPPHIAALFPKRLADNGVPEGWETKQVGEVFDIVAGNTPSTEEERFWGGPHAWTTPKDLSRLPLPVLLAPNRTLSEAGLAACSSGLLPIGTLLLSSRAPIGYLGFANVPTAINQGIAAFRRKNLSTTFAWVWCQAEMSLIKASANGSTFMEISKGNLRRLPMVQGSRAVMESFVAIVDPLIDHIVIIAEQNLVLSTLRDTLLPKLISGELRIRDAEKIAESA